MKKLKLGLSQVQIIALGFLILIAVGTALLALPIATKSGQSAGLELALFTSVSASCVTGFVLQETALYWSDFGHVVIMLLFQTGGLGVMTIATMFFMLMRKRVGLRQREVMVESLNHTQVGGIVRLLNELLLITGFSEIFGAILLAIRFIPTQGFWRGLWYGLFHSVSAFCNAGFDLFGGGSLQQFSDDLYVNIILMLLIIMGGIGFLVLDDICKNKLNFRRYSLQSKVVLSSSAILTAGGAVLFWIFERNASLEGMSAAEQILTSLFMSVTSRNAGFTTTDPGLFSSGGKMLLMLLMFIGGSPGSTAGGVKTTTVVVIILHTLRGIRHHSSVNAFGRRIDEDAVKKAVAIVTFNLMLIFAGVFLICGLHPELELDLVLFDVISAIGTAGISSGVVQEFSRISLLIIMALMFLGRFGSISLAVALLEKKAAPPISYPVEKITIG